MTNDLGITARRIYDHGNTGHWGPGYRGVAQISTVYKKNDRTAVIVDFLVLMAIASFPVYLFPSGGPQISHVFFTLFLAVFARDFLVSLRRWSAPFRGVFRPLLAFVSIATIVQLFYAVVLAEYEMLKYPIFLAYNALYCLAIYHYLRVRGPRGATVILLAALAAILLSCTPVIALGTSTSYRQTSLFNNPNQLGYFALLFTIVLLALRGQHRWKLGNYLILLGVVAGLYLAAVSLSKAAIIATAVAIALFITRLKRNEIFLITIVACAVSPFLAQRVLESTPWQRVQHRISSIGEQADDRLAGRGYGRLLMSMDSMTLLLLGAGEGAYERFGSKYSTNVMELHSTIGSIIFCYGMTGFITFAVFNYRCYRLAGRNFVVLFLPVFLYGLTHNGIRFTALWLLYALFLYIAEVDSRQATPAPTQFRRLP